ncbi:MAG: hypothetical protein AB1486_34930 [Planctomycetota bacterium]
MMRPSSCVALALLLSTWGCFAPPERGASFDPYRDALDAAPTRFVERAEGPTTGERVAWYFPDRFLDLIDIFDLQFAVGPGAAAELHLTKFLWAGTANEDVYSFGLEGRRIGIVRERRIGDWRFGPMHSEEHEASVTSLAGSRSTYEEPNPIGVPSAVRQERHPADLAVGLHLLVAGLRVAFKPAELVDFLGGWFTWDPMEDDLGARRVAVSGVPAPVHTIDRFLQALDNLEFKTLRSCLTHSVWVNTWVKQEDGTILSGRRYEEQKTLGQIPDGIHQSGEAAAIEAVGAAAQIDTVVVRPEAYRDATDKAFHVRFELEEIAFRHGVPETLWGRLIATRSSGQWVDTFDVRMKVEDRMWKIDRFVARTKP